jgi:S-adenosylmethionine:tRNA ribosyltransferase-isomerase
MLISDLDYDLPAELIAQEPLAERQASRMLVVDRGDGTMRDGSFADLPSLLDDGDLLVLNNTRVFPARLIGHSDTGAQIEIFLIEQREHGIWEALARPARRLRPGKNILFGSDLTAEVIEKLPDGHVIVRFAAARDIDELIDELGRTPLPPYIKRDGGSIDADRDRYQTVFAKVRGAIAAPTAGLHFTSEVLHAIAERGVETAEVTLHVGYGTFEPVRVDDVAKHRVSPERFEIAAPAAEQLERARRDGRRIVAVGTTTTRALETCISRHGRFVAGQQTADLTITPGYEFGAVGAMLTNFHLPQSSLLILVSTFAGHELIMRAYRHAVVERYRFYSYGDCMLIV